MGFALSLDPEEVRDHDVALADAFRARLDLGPSDSAIVSWAKARASISRPRSPPESTPTAVRAWSGTKRKSFM